MKELSIFELVFLIVVALYILQQIFFLIGFFWKHRKLQQKDDYPSFTVIVAARNEENNILKCLNSLNKLNYPENKLEIIVVDDYSTDATNKLVSEFIKDKNNFKLIKPSKKLAKLSGKANAIANAIEVAKGEIIATTDADCEVQPDWINTLASYYVADVGIVCGFTLQKSKSIFTGIQNLDWVYLLTVAAGAMNLRVPLSCIGNNMSYRSKAYNLIGGYEKLKFSVTEDFALMHKIFDTTEYNLVYINDYNAVNYSEPCKNWKELIRQKHRWGRGGLDSKFIGFLVMAWGFLSHLFFFLQIILGSIFSLKLTLIKIISDFIFITIPAIKLKTLKDLKYFFFFELYFILYVLLLPFLVLTNKKVIWKDRVY